MPRRKRDEISSEERNAAREERILMYQDRASKGLGIFTGEPIPAEDEDDGVVDAEVEDDMLAEAVA